MLFGDASSVSSNPSILTFSLAPARSGLSPNSLQEFFDTLVSTALMSRLRDELQTGIPRLSTVKFRLRTVARAKLNAISTCAKMQLQLSQNQHLRFVGLKVEQNQHLRKKQCGERIERCCHAGYCKESQK